MFAQWKPRVLPLTHKILISHQIKHHLKWWTNRDRFIQDVPLTPVQETHTLFTDASVSGWGAHLESKGLLFHGVWTNDQSQLHINVLEMMAISMALERAHHVIHNFTVNVTDNASVVSYIIKQRGTFPNLVYGSLEPSVVVSSIRGITLKVRHIPGIFNILADRLSRMLKPVPTKWCLNQTIASLVFSMMGYPNIDLFATRLNNRLPVYVSPIPDSKTLAIDALTISWDHIHGYAFPPFHVIPRFICFSAGLS